MKESDYMHAGNAARLNIIRETLHAMYATKLVSRESIDSFSRWIHRSLDKHYAYFDNAVDPEKD